MGQKKRQQELSHTQHRYQHTCTASSRVGVSTRAYVAAIRLFLYNSLSSRGKEKAAVLPEPARHSLANQPAAHLCTRSPSLLGAARLFKAAALDWNKSLHAIHMTSVGTRDMVLYEYILTCDSTAANVPASQRKWYTCCLQCMLKYVSH